MLTQRLTPQQIQLIKLLQVPSIDIRARIEQELADNPVLEESHMDDITGEIDLHTDELTAEYDWNSAVTQQQLAQRNRELQARQAKREANLPLQVSLYEQLLAQLNLLKLDKRQHQIGQHLIGSLENDGYIRRDLEAIVNDLSFTAYIETNIEEVGAILKQIQNFDPPGFGFNLAIKSKASFSSCLSWIPNFLMILS